MERRRDPLSLRLGEADAYREADLNEVFQPTPQYIDITDPHYLFLCGRRGAGKSAIAQMLEARAHSWRYRASVPGEWRTYRGYQQIVQQLVSSPGTLRVKDVVNQLWAWVLRTKAMQVIVEADLRDASQDVTQLDREASAMLSYLDTLPSIHRNLHRESPIGQLLSDVFLEARKAAEGIENYLVNLGSRPEYLAAVRALARKTAPKSNRLLLVFDTLESYRIFEPFMIEGITGVVTAVVEFASDIPVNRGIEVKLFLPTEIIDSVVLDFPHKAKSDAVFLRWFGADSIAMLARRYLRLIDKNQLVDPHILERLRASVAKAEENKDGKHLREEFWYGTGFLPRTVTNRNGDAEDCLGYMFRHTFRRPRDLMAQLQAILEVAQEHLPKCTERDVRDGVNDPRTLENMLGDAVSPYQVDLPEDQRPEGGLPKGLLDVARNTFSETQSVMTGREANRFALKLHNIYRVRGIEPSAFLEVLVKCGTIGWIPEEELARGGKFVNAKFEYAISTNIPIENDRTYCAHPVMATLFEMPPRPGLGVIYPRPDYDDWLEREGSYG